MNDYKNRVFINEFEQKPLKNELIDVVEILDIPDINNNKQKTKLIEVKNEEEMNSSVKVKPMNDVKKIFLNDREQRKHEKLMKKKRLRRTT